MKSDHWERKESKMNKGEGALEGVTLHEWKSWQASSVTSDLGN